MLLHPESRRSARHGIPAVGRAAALLLALLAPSRLWSQATPAGTQVRGWATVTYTLSGGLVDTVGSDTATVLVGQVAGVDVEPPTVATGGIGTSVLLRHTLRNAGNGVDSFTVAAASARGWPVAIYRDADGDGQLDATDPPVTGPVPLGYGVIADLLVQVTIPNDTTLRGLSDTVTVSAASLFDAGATDALQDRIDVPLVGLSVALVKAVDRVAAFEGDILTYTLQYAVAGAGLASPFVVTDTVPPGTSYVAGTLRWNGAPLTDLSGDDAGTMVPAGNGVAVFDLGTLAAGAAGDVNVQVRVGSGPARTVPNAGHVAYAWAGGPDTVSSNTVQTAVVVPALALEKLVSGPSQAFVGQQLRYTLRYRNAAAAAPATGAVVSDTLPAGLDYVSATPGAAVAGQVLTWSVGDLAAGDSGVVDLVVQVNASVRDTVWVQNVAALAATNASAQAVLASPVALIGPSSIALGLDLTPGVLEVGVGEAIPFTAVVRNPGIVALSALRVGARLGAGLRAVTGSVLGADSARVQGDSLILFTAAPLAPGESRTLRFVAALTSAPGPVAEARALATGDAAGTPVASLEALAWVQVRRSWPMDTRAAIGKVWLDLDGDGRQAAGEPGLAGIDIWSEDGEVARTDATGKFSFDDVRPGRHAFRLDARTLGEYRLAGDEIQLVEASGWTTPRVDFRLVPLTARLVEVHQPVEVQFAAVPICRSLGEVRLWLPNPAATVQFGTGSAALGAGAGAALDPVARSLRSYDACAARVEGHADARRVVRGPHRDNEALSRARAQAVADYVTGQGIEPYRLFVEAHGASRPVASGRDSASLALNRRVEVRLDARRPDVFAEAIPVKVRYEVVVRQRFDADFAATVSFAPRADSALVFVNDSLVSRYSWLEGAIALPAGRPGAAVRIQAWSSEPRDSATATFQVGRRLSLVRAPVHNPFHPVGGAVWARARASGLPAADSLAPDRDVAIVLEPLRAAWPDVAYDLPAGWRVVPGSVRLGERPAPDPDVRRDAAGRHRLRWRFANAAWALVTLRLAPEPASPLTAAAPVTARETVTVAAARPAAERAAERQQAFLRGPGVEIFAPVDGAVSGGDRVFVGVRGEPSATVILYDGATPVDTGGVRPDGVHDFVAVPLARGPHRLRVVMKNSWGQERWDSVAVHVTGLPARFAVAPSPLRLVADGRTTATADVRVLDAWGVPVVHPAYVTVTPTGAEVLGEDADASSVGLQLRSDAAGRLTVELRAAQGGGIGRGVLGLTSGDATATLALEVGPEIRPLIVTGAGLVGVGAAPETYGSITARGRLDERTSLTLGVDSRRLDAGRDAFERSHDPLEESQYPILGDAAERQTLTASQSWFSARLERGFDWIALGDVATNGFAEGLSLVQYRRALTGVAARVTTGAVTWSGFGSLTGQALRQLQLRGAGVSGPYDLGPDVREGSEYLRIETRAAENAERLIASQSLTRFVDYQIDYRRGVVLLKRPLPAADASGNPVFLVATFEVASGATEHVVAGARAAVNATALLGGGRLDSLRFGVTAVNAGEAGADYRLLGADFRALRHGGLDAGAEVAFAEQGDSSDLAGSARLGYSLLDGDLTLGVAWSWIGREFLNPGNLGLRGGTTELAVKGGWRSAVGELRGEYARQEFERDGVTRDRARLGVVRRFGRTVQFDVAVANDAVGGGGSPEGRTTAGEIRATWQPAAALGVWAEARQHFALEGQGGLPDHWGLGATYRFSRRVALEAGQRLVTLANGAGSYAVTSTGVRADVGFGTQAWGSYQLAGGVGGARNAAVVGLSNRVQLTPALTANLLLERRMGVSGAPIADPVRALPFLQAEEDYWSAGAGLELLPERAPYRLAARAELKVGELGSSGLVTLAGDAALDASLALLSRQEFFRTERVVAGPALSRRFSSVWGVAFRPARTDRVNMLAKFQWTDEENPIGGGVLAAQGDEQRVIGAAEVIWTPQPWAELGARYAVRRTAADRVNPDSTTQSLTSWADYAGARFNLDLSRRLSLRGDARLLVERTTATSRWDAAPAVAWRPAPGLELAAGYRFGDLSDPDFSVRGGHGAFVTLSARVTERLFPTAAEFWRGRF